MPAVLLAILVFVVVALAVFAAMSLLDQRSAQARLIKERLANERQTPQRAPEEELALLRDEQLSQIPALDDLLRRSSRVADLQKMLVQGGIAAGEKVIVDNLQKLREGAPVNPHPAAATVASATNATGR